MKSVPQIVLLLGLVAPAFSAAPDVDFDGRAGHTKDAPSFQQSTPWSGLSPALKPDSNVPALVRKLERLGENGEFIEILPETVVDSTGKKIKAYTTRPNWLVRWRVYCPGNGSWSMRVTYAWNATDGGHEHYNPPPRPLLLSYSQSAQVPPTNTFSFIPSPVNFPVMQGNSTPYYYWIWYPDFATREVEWTQAWGACSSNREDTTYIKEDGLVALTNAADSGYVLTGMTGPHPYNHQAMPAAVTALRKIAWEYKQQFPGQVLRYNDFSLPWGGLFDIGPVNDCKYDYNQDGVANEPCRFWQKPHSTHRFGWHADVEKEGVPEGNYEALNQIFTRNGARVLVEGNHWHLDFTPRSDKHYEEELKCY